MKEAEEEPRRSHTPPGSCQEGDRPLSLLPCEWGHHFPACLLGLPAQEGWTCDVSRACGEQHSAFRDCQAGRGGRGEWLHGSVWEFLIYGQDESKLQQPEPARQPGRGPG